MKYFIFTIFCALVAIGQTVAYHEPPANLGHVLYNEAHGRTAELRQVFTDAEVAANVRGLGLRGK